MSPQQATSDGSTRTKTIAKNSFWVSVDTVLGVVSSLLISVLVARKLGPDDLGYFNFILWLTIIAGRVALYGTALSVRKYAAEYLGRGDVASAHAILRTSLRQQALVSAGIMATAVVLIFAFLTPVHRPFAFWAAASLVPQLLMVIYSGALAAAENFRANVIATVASTLVNMAGVFALLALGFGLTAVTFSLFASRMIDYAIRRLQFKRHFPKTDRKAELSHDQSLKRRMTRFYWLTNVLLVLNIVVWDRSELFFLKTSSTLKQLAFYSLAFNISTQVLNVPQMIAMSASASLMVQYGRDARKTGVLTATATRYMCLLAFPALLGVAAVATPLLRVLYSEQYVEAGPVLMWLALLSLPRTLMLAPQNQIVAFERQAFLVKWIGGMAFLNVAMDMLLIERYGALGAAWGNGIAQGVSAAGIVYYAVRRLDVTISFSNIGRILAASVAMALPVAAVARALPPLPAVLTAIPLGILLYPLALRATGALLEEDYRRLSLFLPRIPTRCRGAAARALRAMVAEPSQAR